MRRSLLILTAVFYIMSLRFEDLAKQNGNGVYILLSQGISTAEAAEIAQSEQDEEHPLGFCFYGISEATTLENPETGRTAQATMIPLYGNGELLNAGPLSWGEGCMVDTETAQTLFGTDKLGAQQVQVEERTLTALGTVSAQTPTVLVAAKEDASLNRCVIAGWDENGKQEAEQFLLRHGLTGKILNFYPLLIFTKNLTLLPLWTLLVLLCLWVRTKNKRLVWLAAFVGAALLGSRVIIPKDTIPSMWSDFSFWGSWVQKQRENVLLILMSNVGELTLKMEENMVKSDVCALAGTILTAWAGRRTRRAPAADRG